MQMVENVLSDLSLLFCRGSAKLVEVAVKPFVDFSVLRMVKITDLLTCFTFLAGLGLCSRTILISAANVDGIMTSETSISGIDISRENTTDDISEMGHVVHIW